MATNCYQTVVMVANGCELLPMVTNGYQWRLLLPNGSECILLTNGLEYSYELVLTVTNGHEWFHSWFLKFMLVSPEPMIKSEQDSPS